MPTRPPGHESLPAEPAAAPWWRSAWPWLAVVLLGVGLQWWWNAWGGVAAGPPIVVGILHSNSGPTAAIEKTLVEAELLAIESINASGGLLGRRLEAVVADGGVDGATFARRAERLIREDRADVIVGCFTAASRRAVLPVVEAADHLLVHPARHEGFEESAAFVSMGPLPNQHVVPAVAWCRDALAASRLFVVGDDGVWSRAAAALASDQLVATGGAVAGEHVLVEGSTDLSAAVKAVIAADPDAVCCLLPGETAALFLRRLREAGLRSPDLPVLLLAVDEDDLRAMPREDVTGAYVAAAYFQGIDRTADQDFVRAFKTRYGNERSTSERVLSAHEAVRLWAEAVRAAGTADVATVRSAIRRQTLATPEGMVAVDPSSMHAWRGVTVGRVRPDGLVEPVWSASRSTRPVPFPATRSRGEWTRFLAAIERERAVRRDAAPRRPEAARPEGASP